MLHNSLIISKNFNFFFVFTSNHFGAPVGSQGDTPPFLACFHSQHQILLIGHFVSLIKLEIGFSISSICIEIQISY